MANDAPTRRIFAPVVIIAKKMPAVNALFTALGKKLFGGRDTACAQSTAQAVSFCSQSFFFSFFTVVKPNMGSAIRSTQPAARNTVSGTVMPTSFVPNITIAASPIAIRLIAHHFSIGTHPFFFSGTEGKQDIVTP